MRVAFLLLLLIFGSISHAQENQNTITFSRKISKNIVKIFCQLKPENRKKLMEEYLVEFDKDERGHVKNLILPAFQKLFNPLKKSQGEESCVKVIQDALLDFHDIILDAHNAKECFSRDFRAKKMPEIQSFVSKLEAIENKYSRIFKGLNHMLECYRYEAEHGQGSSEGKEFFSLRESACIALALLLRDFRQEDSQASDMKRDLDSHASAACGLQTPENPLNSSQFEHVYDLYLARESKMKEDIPVNLTRIDTNLKKAIAELFPPLQQKTAGPQHSDASVSTGSVVLVTAASASSGAKLPTAPSSEKPDLEDLIKKIRHINKAGLRKKPGYAEKVRRKWEEIIDHYPLAEKPEFVKKVYGESTQKEVVPVTAAANAPTAAMPHPTAEVDQKEKVTKEGSQEKEKFFQAENDAKSQAETIYQSMSLVELPLHRQDIREYFLVAYNRHPEKLIKLGDRLYTGELMGYRDYAASLCCYQYAMNLGAAGGQEAYAHHLFSLGCEYLTGVVRPVDMPSAEILFMIASGYGNPFAANNLGNLYFEMGRHQEAINHLTHAWNQWKSPITADLLKRLYGVSVA